MITSRPLSLLVVLGFLAVAGCDQPEVDPNLGEPLGRCIYINGFSGSLECKEYLGSNWTDEAIADNCAAPVPGSDPGTFEEGLSCDRSSILGQCFIDAGTVEAATIVFPGEEGDSCAGLAMGCGFAGGEYVPAAACGGEDPDVDFGPSTPFEPFAQVCVDPLPGTPPGMGPGGQVCTWEAISAATEEGRYYSDYASCDPVLTQRPYWAAEVVADTPSDDPRYSDKFYMLEYAWATEQVESTACVCCHSAADSPNNLPSGWYVDGAGLWTDTLDDDGLAMLAGWIDSTAFGSFAPRDNNGFHRHTVGLPTTSPKRMQRFLVTELARRGLVEADFAGAPPFGGPLADQLTYEPQACEGSAGIDSSGLIRWAGGGARYLYVLQADSANPGVPPNLDLPEGTLWRLDVGPEDSPMTSGVTYGTVPQGATQSFPADGAPAPLLSGQTYYLYAMMDVALPLSRCLFTAP
ncbi:MAG: proteinase inhibitor [Myxococcota bacterium]|nr:proteinase inhibitor [Myxococcota bacterium]